MLEDKGLGLRGSISIVDMMQNKGMTQVLIIEIVEGGGN